ncbi:MAG: magnesium transporter [Verrucomicrobiales bacterium]|nr:magnesium transporter [Verrucomicrobiales bacterium]
MPDTESTSHIPVSVDEIVDALRSQSPDRILAISKQAHPGDVEMAFERFDEVAREEVLDKLPAEVLSEWADYLSPGDVEHRLNSLPKGEQREVLESLSDDELVDLLQEIEEEDRPQYIELLPEEKRIVSEDLMRFPEETAGGRMTMAMATVRQNLTVKEALDELRCIQNEAELLSRIFVVDENRKLLGKLRLRDLAFNTWDTPITELMDGDQTCVSVLADQEEAAQMIARYDLVALPVVDENDQLVGVITHDDALEIMEEESTEDMEKISGIGGDRGDLAYLQTSVLSHIKRRFGWVLVLAFLALISGWVLLKYEEVLKAYFTLALYFPMIVAAGGNTGSQAATMVIRAMSLGELGSKEFGRVLWKELRVGILLGAMLGLCVALQVEFLLPDQFMPEGINSLRIVGIVGFALTAQVMTSTLIGALLPQLAKMGRLDPAVVASPAITTMVDVSGAIIYLGLAKVMLGVF